MPSSQPIWDKKLAAFLALAIVIGLIANLLARHIFGLGDSGTIVIFALLVGVLALVFPRQAAPLSKDTVDLWYYLLGIVTVVAVFANNEGERRKLILVSEYQHAAIEKASFDGRIAALRHIVASPNETFAKLQSRSREIADDLVSTKDYFCRCAMPMAQCGDLPGSVGLSRRKWGEPDFEARASRDGYAKVCNELVREKREDQWLQLSRLTTLSELSAFDMKALQGGGRGLSVDGMQVSVEDVISNLVAVHAGSKDLEVKRLALESDLAAKITELQRARGRYDDVGKIEDRLAHFSWNFVIGFLWPYLLISLLALKIARVKYF